MARTLTPTIPPKMYRHFALVTVLLTAGIAMFASGENREAAAAQIEERQQRQEFEQKSREKFGPPTVGRRAEPRHGTFASDDEVFDQRFGRPTARSGGWASTADSAPQAARASQAGYSEQYLATLSDEGRELLRAEMEAENRLSPEEREQRDAALLAASSRRSGGASIGD